MSPNEVKPAPFPYRKLPGDFRGFLNRNTMWLGSDHLLMVNSSRFSETYKRFYLRDIQTLIVRQTPRFVLPNYWVVLAGAAVIALLIGLNPFREPVFWPAVAIFAGVIVYLYIASMFQSCVCHVITRVNKVELPSLFRLGAAQRFVEVVTPQIIAAQGELPADWIERSTTLAELSTAADQNPDTPVELLLPAREFSPLPVAVFLLMLVDAGLTVLAFRMDDATSLATPNVVNMIAIAVCATFAIVRLSRQSGGRALRGLVLAALCVVGAGTYASIMLQSIDRQYHRETSKNPIYYTGMKPLSVAEIIGDLAVAIPGLILAFRPKRGPAGQAPSYLNTGEPKP